MHPSQMILMEGVLSFVFPLGWAAYELIALRRASPPRPGPGRTPTVVNLPLPNPPHHAPTRRVLEDA
jgi:hypothetical protein